MYKLINGEYAELTEDEIQELIKSSTEPKVTMENRIHAIESAITDLATMLMGGV